ncbi:DUF928 domain-containing protein [Roseofilum sp. Belize Diploria]|uniref:DUF928 domain-containing protein n=1 Tax=Roseofilum sp. Belize Diploria TaxID=2821501 RepID=UPI001B1B19A3|nr:DUF928 domain-containing protein [Roseofilum sp. Belize Diploria]MBP0009449.1 DUF928 domain-containing protein [Roseofilum sp. Belize Diploria]
MFQPFSRTLIYLSCYAAFVTGAFSLPQASLAQLPTDHNFEPPPGAGRPNETVGGGSRLLEEVLQIDFEPPPGQGAPRETVGGASRGPKCLPHEMPVTVLVPRTIQGIKYGLTVDPSPDFFVYIPDTVATQIEFIVTDNQPYPNGQIIDERVIDIPQKPGIIRIPLEGKLENDQYYEWAIYLQCPQVTPGSEPSFAFPSSGWIKKIAVDETLQQKVEASSVMEMIITYAKEGIWFDTLSVLYEQLEKHPNNDKLQKTWKHFLQNQITDIDPLILESSIVNCCQP